MPNDAFISYSHRADAALAAATEKALERIAKPFFAFRAMEVFRDASDLPASPGLLPALEAQLEASRWFVFFASPASAQSAYCNNEITWWIGRRGTTQILLVLTEGQIVWNRNLKDFDWQATDALPLSLKGVFATEPLYVDLREFRKSDDISLSNPAFRAAMLNLAAPIRGVPKNSLDNEDVRRQRQLRWLARTAVAAISVLGVIATFMAIIARQQAQVSLARQLSAQALQIVRAQPDLGLLLAVESLHVTDTVQGRTALLSTLLDRPHLRRVLHGVTQAELEQQGFRFVGQTQPPVKRPSAPNGAPVDCEGGVETASRSADGRLAVYGCYAGAVRIADTQQIWTGISRIGHDQPVTSVVLVDSGRVVVSGGYDGRILLWHSASGAGMEPALTENERPVLMLGLSADGKTLASIHEDGSTKLWDLAMRPRLKRPLAGIDSPDEVLAGLQRSAVQSMVIYWQLGDAQRLATLISKPEASDRFIGFRADGRPAFASTFNLSSSQATVVDFDRDLGIVVVRETTGRDGKSQLRVRGGGSGLNVAFETPGYVSVAAVAPDGQRVAGVVDRTLWFWSLPSGAVAAGPVELESAPHVLRFDRTGAWLVAGRADGRVQPLDAQSGKRLRPALDAHGSTAILGVRSLAASPDGTMLASGGVDGQIMLWDTSNWQRRASFPAHGFARRAGPIFEGQISVTALAFSPDGSSLVAGTGDGLAIWFRGDQEWTRRPLSARNVDDLAFTPDGSALLTSGGDGQLTWALAIATWKRLGCEIAGRNLTSAEWQQYMTFSGEARAGWMRILDPEYRETCTEHTESSKTERL